MHPRSLPVAVLSLAAAVWLAACDHAAGGQMATQGTTDGQDHSHGSNNAQNDGVDHHDGTTSTNNGTTTPGDVDLGVLGSPTVSAFKQGDLSTSQVCRDCHSNATGAQAMRDSGDRAIAPFDLWQSTMMANSARDPFWRAMVAAEIERTPAARDAIEAKCVRCHAPLASADAEAAGEHFGPSDLTSTDRRAQLGADGVSCVVCHKIDPENLGQPESLSGHWELVEGGTLYGVYANPFTRPMEMHTGYTPTPSDHMTESSLCATCHTLLTSPLSAQGEVAGTSFPEQTPWLEWRNSVFNDEGPNPANGALACVGCHAPDRDEDGQLISTRAARRPDGSDFPQQLSPRSPFRRLTFVGGNTLLPAILRDERATLGTMASDEALNATIARATEQLQTRTAALTVLDTTQQGDNLAFTVRVRNFAGHKLPTGFPSRRVWLRVRVEDQAGTTLFESGAFDDIGRLVGPDGTTLGSEQPGGGPQPHHEEIVAPEQVQIYEAVMGDAQGAPTWTLLRASAYLKDNRLLPQGFDLGHEDIDLIAPVGVDGDGDFSGGEDRVRFQITAPGAARIVAELYYQTLGARFAAELFQAQAPEVRAFEALLQRADRTPVRVAEASRDL